MHKLLVQHVKNIIPKFEKEIRCVFEAIASEVDVRREKFGVKYGNYIGDGDWKTFKAISDVNPYGDELIVVKSECIGHVEKRMATRKFQFNNLAIRS